MMEFLVFWMYITGLGITGAVVGEYLIEENMYSLLKVWLIALTWFISVPVIVMYIAYNTEM